MPPVPAIISGVGFAKQSGKGAPTTPPTYGHGVRDGKVFNLEIDQEAEAITLLGGASDRFAPAHNRQGAVPGAGFKTRLWPRSSGLYLYSALGTIQTTGPVGGVYQHLISPAQDLPWNTLYGRLGSDYIRLPDTKVDELTISWEGRQPAELELALLGLVPAINYSSWTATNDETAQTYFGPVGGILQLNPSGAVGGQSQITAGEIHIANNLEVVQLSKSILPDDLVPGNQVVDGSFKLKPNDLADFKKIATGSSAGTAVQETPVYGALSIKFVIDANIDLLLVANRVAFMCEFPDSNAEGGAAEVECAFEVDRPTDGTAAFTATLRNATASY